MRRRRMREQAHRPRVNRGGDRHKPECGELDRDGRRGSKAEEQARDDISDDEGGRAPCSDLPIFDPARPRAGEALQAVEGTQRREGQRVGERHRDARPTGDQCHRREDRRESGDEDEREGENCHEDERRHEHAEKIGGFIGPARDKRRQHDAQELRRGEHKGDMAVVEAARAEPDREKGDLHAEHQECRGVEERHSP
jgi:hypothetical protein